MYAVAVTTSDDRTPTVHLLPEHYSVTQAKNAVEAFAKHSAKLYCAKTGKQASVFAGAPDEVVVQQDNDSPFSSTLYFRLVRVMPFPKVLLDELAPTPTT